MFVKWVKICIKGRDWTCRLRNLPGAPARDTRSRAPARGTAPHTPTRDTAWQTPRRVLPRSHRDLRCTQTSTQ